VLDALGASLLLQQIAQCLLQLGVVPHHDLLPQQQVADGRALQANQQRGLVAGLQHRLQFGCGQVAGELGFQRRGLLGHGEPLGTVVQVGFAGAGLPRQWPAQLVAQRGQPRQVPAQQHPVRVGVRGKVAAHQRPVAAGAHDRRPDLLRLDRPAVGLRILC
jgi:hypothetical protein